jgi:hypothetical protein
MMYITIVFKTSAFIPTKSIASSTLKQGNISATSSHSRCLVPRPSSGGFLVTATNLVPISWWSGMFRLLKIILDNILISYSADYHASDSDATPHWTLRVYDARSIHVATMHVYDDRYPCGTIVRKIRQTKFLSRGVNTGDILVRCFWCVSFFLLLFSTTHQRSVMGTRLNNVQDGPH